MLSLGDAPFLCTERSVQPVVASQAHDAARQAKESGPRWARRIRKLAKAREGIREGDRRIAGWLR